VVNAPPELADTIASTLAPVKGCTLIAARTTAHAAQLLLGQRRLGLFVVYVGDTATCQAVHGLLRLAASCKPAVPVVVLAESSFEEAAAEWVAAGAADCLLRPLNLSRLAFLFDFLTLRQRTCGCLPEAAAVASASPARTSGGLVFASAVAHRLQAMAARLARVDTTVLLQGETGSGKSCVARLIHKSSPRASRPLVVVNCGSVPESLVEGELFGYRQGAYTGADRNHRGKFAQAEDGTLFLDEIDSLSLRAQSSLLRVVEERAYEALGSDVTEKLRARLVFATNRDLAGEVNAGRFRRDLYYRLNVVALSVPPLRSRSAEIPVLVTAFLRDLRANQATNVREFAPDALAAMERHSWPGNLRELRNVVEQAAVMCDGQVVTASDLPLEIRSADYASSQDDDRCGAAGALPVVSSQLATARQMAERQTIIRTLQQCSHNRSRAAQQLGISRAAFYKKLHQLGIA